MVIKSIIGVFCTCLAVVSFSANSTLVERLGGLAYYDTEADLTWLADASYGAGSSYDVIDQSSNGAMRLFNAMDWASSLNVAGVTGWRLPNTAPSDASCDSLIGSVSNGFNCTGSEMGNLFYNALGNTAGSLTNTGPFSNVQLSWYWSATEVLETSAYVFGMNNGDQSWSNTFNQHYVWAVHDGDVGATHIPVVIDIKPSKKTENIINLKTDKNLKVAIVGEEAFDALQVAPETVKFGSNEASPVRFKGQDYNRDGFPDLILTFKLNQTGITCGDTKATLTGETYGKEVIEGSDFFTVEPCP